MFGQKAIDDKKEDYCRKNELESRKRCEAVLKLLSQELEDKVQDGIYSCPNGYKQFVADLKKVEERYLQEPRKGVMVGKGWDYGNNVLKNTHILMLLGSPKVLWDKQETQNRIAQSPVFWICA